MACKAKIHFIYDVHDFYLHTSCLKCVDVESILKRDGLVVLPLLSCGYQSFM